MKKLKLLGKVLKQTKASKILLSFFIFIFVDALLIFLIDPAINSYGNALWYCCSVISTSGFGDFVATTAVTKILTVLLMVYAVLVLAIVTGVIVNFYNQLITLRQQGSLAAIAHKLEDLPNMSKEELQELSDKIKKLNKNKDEDD